MIQILKHYSFGDDVEDIEAFGNGNINKTYLATTTSGEKYILQQINTHVFKKPKDVMKNIELVTNHIRNVHRKNGLDSDNAVLNIVPTTKGTSYVKLADNYWRVYGYVYHSTTYETTNDPVLFKQVGIAIGAFQKFLHDFDSKKLAVTIPDFHNTPKRYRDFEKIVDKDPEKRAIDIYGDIKFLFDRKDGLSKITDRLDNDEIPVRVTHNDTKLNNVMIDKTTKQALCIIDLDTVMPGSVLYDFGDAVRIGASTAKEDESDLSKINFDLKLFEAFTEGFIREAGRFLTEKEIDLLVDSVWIITMEIAMRFLGDYLNGDQYFRTDYEDHNLIRARSQMKLVEELEQYKDDMEDIVRHIVS